MGISFERFSVYLIAALLPLERLGAVELAGTTVRPSQIVLLFGVLAVLRTWLHDRDAFEWRRPEYLLLLFFIGANALSLLRAENFARSLTVLAYTVFTLLLVPVMVTALRKPAHLRVMRNVLLASAAAVGLFGLWQFTADMIGLPRALTGLRPQYTKAILGFTRVQATAIEPLYFANYLLLPLALAITWIMQGAKRHWMLVALTALLLGNLVLTASRGAYFAFAAMLVVIIWSYRRDAPALKRFFALALAGLTVAVVAVQALALFRITTPGTLTDSFVAHTTTLTDGAAYIERLETFERAVRAWESSPWIGIGVGGYGPFSATYAQIEPERGWAIVNNEPLELLAETGILGFTAMLAFLGYVLWLGGKKPERNSSRSDQIMYTVEPVRVAALASVIGIAVQYQTFSTLYIMHVWFAIGLLLATARMRP